MLDKYEKENYMGFTFLYQNETERATHRKTIDEHRALFPEPELKPEQTSPSRSISLESEVRNTSTSISYLKQLQQTTPPHPQPPSI